MINPGHHVIFRTRATASGPSLIVKHSVKVAGRKTSVSLEDAFWTELRRFARADHLRLCDLVDDIAAGGRNRINLSSSIRLYVVDRLKEEFATLARARAPRIPVLREAMETS